MTSREWVESVLSAELDGEAIVLSEDQVIMIDDFCTIFGGAIDAELAKPEGERSFYTALSGSHIFQWEGETLTMTAAELGYQEFFDQCQAEGLFT